mgnify:CR=1 FL=1
MHKLEQSVRRGVVAFVGEELLTPFPANVVSEQTLLLYNTNADRSDTDAAAADAAHDAGAADVLTQAEQPSNAALQLDVDGFQQLADAHSRPQQEQD